MQRLKLQWTLLQQSLVLINLLICSLGTEIQRIAIYPNTNYKIEPEVPCVRYISENGTEVPWGCVWHISEKGTEVPWGCVTCTYISEKGTSRYHGAVLHTFLKKEWPVKGNPSQNFFKMAQWIQRVFKEFWPNWPNSHNCK